MSKNGQTIFTPVKDDEKAQIFADLLKYPCEMKLKELEPRSDVISVIPRSITGTRILCSLIGKPTFSSDHFGVVVQFDLGDHKYITQIEADAKPDSAYLYFTKPIYRVQRREDFRLRLPPSYRGSFKFTHEGNPINCRIVDLSAGGCRIQVPLHVILKRESTIHGIFQTENRDDMEIEAQVRHISKPVDKEKFALTGLQFLNQTTLVKNRMAALVMDLYREFFTGSSRF